jgi:intracellular septation protein A
VLLLPFFGLFLGEYAIVGLALVVIAVLQRNLQLGAWAFIFGLVGTLERFSLISNRVYTLANMLGFNRSNDGYFSWSSSLVYAVLGLALIAGGFFARHREGA